MSKTKASQMQPKRSCKRKVELLTICLAYAYRHIEDINVILTEDESSSTSPTAKARKHTSQSEIYALATKLGLCS